MIKTNKITVGLIILFIKLQYSDKVLCQVLYQVFVPRTSNSYLYQTPCSTGLVICIYVSPNLAFTIKSGLYRHTHCSAVDLIELVYHVTDYVIDHVIIRCVTLDGYYRLINNLLILQYI